MLFGGNVGVKDDIWTLQGSEGHLGTERFQSSEDKSKQVIEKTLIDMPHEYDQRACTQPKGVQFSAYSRFASLLKLSSAEVSPVRTRDFSKKF